MLKYNSFDLLFPHQLFLLCLRLSRSSFVRLVTAILRLICHPSRLFMPSGVNVFNKFCQNISLFFRISFLDCADVEFSMVICSIGISSMSCAKLQLSESKKCCTSLQLLSWILIWLRLLFILILSFVVLLPTYWHLCTLQRQRYITHDEVQPISW